MRFYVEVLCTLEVEGDDADEATAAAIALVEGPIDPTILRDARATDNYTILGP